MNLLRVDDSMVMRDTIEEYLAEYDLNIIGTASNGREALEIVKEKKPDVVTLDITMPEMDGLDCLERIMEINPDTKVMIITALADKLTGLQAIDKGATGFFLKPVDPEELREGFDELLDRV